MAGSHPAHRASASTDAFTWDTKTERGRRWMPLDPESLAALRGYIDIWHEERRLLGQTNRLLFVWPDGSPLHPDTITAVFHKHAAAAVLGQDSAFGAEVPPAAPCR